MHLDEWTSGHDLALVFGALAYGSDLDVNPAELERLVEVVRAHGALPDDEAREVVLEALAVLLDDDGDATGLVLDASRRLYEALSPQQREAALESAIVIAEADGRLLGAERAFLHALAEAWHLKRQAEQRLAESAVDTHEWTLLHDVALMMLAVAHSSDAQL
jgi:tellurite resistance protein